MSNQLISGEYFYKGRINYFLVKCHIYQGNKQIYNVSIKFYFITVLNFGKCVQFCSGKSDTFHSGDLDNVVKKLLLHR